MQERGSHHEFVQLIEQSKRIIFKICFAYAFAPEDRQDLCQEVILQLWRSFPKFDRAMTFSTWLYRIALNTAISHVRKQASKREVAAGNQVLQISISEESDEDAESMALLKQHIDNLSPLNKALIVLHLEDKSYREIGQILGISESNVGTKLSRVKQLLKDSLTKPEHISYRN